MNRKNPLFRINYGNGQVSETVTKWAIALAELMRTHREDRDGINAWLERKDRETGDWVHVNVAFDRCR